MSVTTDGVVPESAADSAGTPVIAVRGIAKHFGSIQALRAWTWTSTRVRWWA